MEPLVSIVVPVYKVEKYLARCVESLVNQSLHDIEIILVDDGSPDQSGKMCDQFAAKDSRIKTVHKENGGLSSARNAGMKEARGKYIGFVDSDDDVELNMYERLAQTAEEHHVDFVMADYKRINRNTSSYVKTLNIDSGYYDRQKIENDIFPALIMGENIDYGPLLSVWHCLYRREFLQKHNFMFDEEVRWSEDNIFSAVMGYYCQSFFYLKGEALYHYYQNEGTITTSYRKGAWDVYSLMNTHLHEFFDNVKEYDFSRQLKLHMVYYACNCISQQMTRPKAEALSGIREILNSKQLKDAFNDFRLPDVPFKLKAQLLMMKYRQTYLLYQMKK